MALVSIRGGDPPEQLLLVREGVNTLGDEALRQACERAQAHLGIHGFSALEVPEGGFYELARLRPLLRTRSRFMLARGDDLRAAGFGLIPTLDHPHWTIVISEPTAAQFALVRLHFSAPVMNPTYTPGASYRGPHDRR